MHSFDVICVSGMDDNKRSWSEKKKQVFDNNFMYYLAGYNAYNDLYVVKFILANIFIIYGYWMNVNEESLLQ